MKEGSPHYEPIPREQLLAARQADLAAYLTARGEQLTPADSQGDFRLPDHDSLYIKENMYQWFSRQEQGNAVDFLQSYYGLGFREAVMELTSEDFSGGGVAGKKVDLPAVERFDFSEIELAPDMQRVIDYLSQRRKLSLPLIEGLIATQQLFQEAQTNNAVFPIYEQGQIVGAEVVGTLPDKRFKGIKTGSKYGCGYNLSFGEQDAHSLFFESAIDLLSFMDISRAKSKDLAGCRLTSMMGLKPNIIDHTAAQLPDAQAFLCVDNDEAGANFIQAMQAQNPAMRVRLPDPAYKDWNDQLQAMKS
ncbi:MAG: toprim domain-containing protein [Oscillospiraceae bacterium]|jgi:hypothetical protein|nr:toprim domain-containing protein [Oscillospiraceae bacterium]